VDLSRLVETHRDSNAEVTVVVVPGDGRGDIGSVQIDRHGRLERFAEKTSERDSDLHINAGIYLASRCTLLEISPGVQVSLENELFPRWLEAEKDMRTFLHDGRCVDIGTPDRYQFAQQLLANVEADTGSPVLVHEV
jgi:mannose-1-phosphate guanylyltransferase